MARASDVNNNIISHPVAFKASTPLTPPNPLVSQDYADILWQLRYHSKKLKKLAKLTSVQQYKETHKRTRFLWIIICSIFCIVQSVHMTQLYLRWEITPEYVHYPTDPILVPAVTFCFEKQFRESCLERECDKYLNTSRIFFENAFNFEDFFIRVAYVKPDSTEHIFEWGAVKQFASFATTRYKHDARTCFHVEFAKYLNGSHYTQMTERNMLVPYLFSAVLAPIHAELSDIMLLVFLSEPGHLPDSIKYATNGFKHERIQLIDYHRTELNLLKPPFRTNCRNYSDTGFLSQRDCLRRCAINESLAKDGRLPPRVAYTSVDDIPFAGTESNNTHLYSDECESKCKQIDCKIVRYAGIQKISLRYDDLPVTVWALQLPNEPDIVVNYKPLMLFAEYLAMMASILGLWLGLSVYSLFEIIVGVKFCIRRSNAGRRVDDCHRATPFARR